MNVNFMKCGLFAMTMTNTAVYGTNTPAWSADSNEEIEAVFYRYEDKYFTLERVDLAVNFENGKKFKRKSLTNCQQAREQFWAEIANDIANSLNKDMSIQRKIEFTEKFIKSISLKKILIRNFLKNILDHVQTKTTHSNEIDKEIKDFELRTLMQGLQIKGKTIKIIREESDDEIFGTFLLKGIKSTILEEAKSLAQEQDIDISETIESDFEIGYAVQAIFSCNDVSKIEPDSIDSFKEAVLLELESFLSAK